MKQPPVLNVDQYIRSFPPATQKLLEDMRAAIKKAAPVASEIISYQMPSYKQNGILVHFAGYKNHIGFYPGAAGVAQFIELSKDYKSSKGAIQFPLEKKLPIALIKKIVAYRIKADQQKADLQSMRKK
ncbi:MAG: DUF1801 domain-containing protein [Pedobacter sp.]|nr:MAG: DUF1801 domain-containing protein [Pedobacter sp.]